MSQGETKKAGRLLEHRFRARAKELCTTRNVVRACLEQSGCCSETVEDLVLAIDEACQNIIRHAYCGETDEEIVLEIGCEGDELVVSLLDYAPEVSPDCLKSRDLDDMRPGGLGCYFIRQVMDDVSLSRLASGHGNVLRMVKRTKKPSE